jgi:hypothetical protein
MATQLEEPRRAEVIRRIAEEALGDAVQITLLINLLETQNSGEVNKRLNEAGAGKAAIVFRNALIARLVLLIARSYSKPRQGDLHLDAAVLLLEDNTMREIFGTGDGGKKLAEFDKQWAKCRGDHRLPAINDFRNKFTAHLGEPRDIQEASYRELFEFGKQTAKAMELLALATGIVVNPINEDTGLISSPAAFWAPWKRD